MRWSATTRNSASQIPVSTLINLLSKRLANRQFSFCYTDKELNQSILAEMLAECGLEVRNIEESVSQEASSSYRKLYEHEESRPECAGGAVLSPKSKNSLKSQQWWSQTSIRDGKPCKLFGLQSRHSRHQWARKRQYLYKSLTKINYLNYTLLISNSI